MKYDIILKARLNYTEKLFFLRSLETYMISYLVTISFTCHGQSDARHHKSNQTRLTEYHINTHISYCMIDDIQ
jgi:hypothetical protein